MPKIVPHSPDHPTKAAGGGRVCTYETPQEQCEYYMTLIPGSQKKTEKPPEKKGYLG